MFPRGDPWRVQLDALLDENARRSTRERLTLIRLDEELRGLGDEGSHAAVRRYALGWRDKHASSTAAAFAPGEAYRFDWSHEIVVMGGVTMTVKVAHMRLRHSRMFIVRSCPRDTQEMVFDARRQACASCINLTAARLRLVQRRLRARDL